MDLSIHSKAFVRPSNSVRLFLTLLNAEFFREETSNAEHMFTSILPSKDVSTIKILGHGNRTSKDLFERNPMGIPTGRHLVDSLAINEVELFHPTVADLPFGSCERCSKGFQSVASAGVTLFQQIVAGDPVKTVPCCQMPWLPWILGFNIFLLLRWW